MRSSLGLSGHGRWRGESKSRLAGFRLGWVLGLFSELGVPVAQLNGQVERDHGLSFWDVPRLRFLNTKWSDWVGA